MYHYICLRHFLQVFWHRLVTNAFLPQYILNFSHLVDVSLHAAGASGYPSAVVSGYPSVGTTLKQDNIRNQYLLLIED